MITAKNNGESVLEMTQCNQDEIAMWKLAPPADWTLMAESEHFAQFYDTDGFLLKSLSGFVDTGLSAGDAVIVVATKAHREGLEEQLLELGRDVTNTPASAPYLSLDAGETLSRFMVKDSPDPERFAQVMGRTIAQAAKGRRRVRIFGEMVALLWAEGNYEAAIRLEELWNHLHETHPFLLFCAYPINGFGGEANAMPLGEVCAAHSRVIPAESYSSLAKSDDRLRAIIGLQQKARSLHAEIRERQEAEEQLRASLIREQMARAEAESANRVKDEFLATVSHELRTPLNAIIGWSHMLRSGRLDEATRAHAVETIERNAKSQAQLVEDILDVSRVITGKLSLSMRPVDLASVINAAIDAVQLAADAKGIQLEVTLDPSARHTFGDPVRLQQVVWNLLSNAIKFTPSDGRVTVRLERADDNVEIRVSDTGQGIKADFLPFIFDRFRQADASSTRRHGGLGLGLAIVRNLVELHRGTIEAYSSGESCGATFAVMLPLALTPEGAKGKRDLESFASNETVIGQVKPLLDDVQVLLVDDDRDNLQTLTAMLREHSARVQAVASVAEALAVLEWYKPNVVVSDLAMPDEDGYSLIGKIRALEAEGGTRQTPVVALTAYVRVEDRARALSAGFNMFVPKPVEPEELITAIANLTESGPSRLWRA